jgi:hypothetical protein
MLFAHLTCKLPGMLMTVAHARTMVQNSATAKWLFYWYTVMIAIQ